MRILFEKIRDKFEETFAKPLNFISNLDISAVHVAIFFGILGLAILISIKVLSNKYFANVNSEVEVLDRVVAIIDKTLSNPGSCEQTLNNAYKSYQPKSLRSIKSSNGYVEFQIEQKPTNSFEFTKFSAHLINKVEDKRSVLTKFTFKHLESEKIYSYYKILNITIKNSRIFTCKMGPRVRL